jgi:hypothetical protein
MKSSRVTWKLTLSPRKLNHLEVIAAGKAAASRMGILLRELITKL